MEFIKVRSAALAWLACCLFATVAQAQEPAKAIVEMALGEKPAAAPPALDLTALPSDWWSQFDGATAQQLGERAKLFVEGMEERILGLAGDDLITAQNGIANLKSLFELLAVAKQGPVEDHFDPIPASEAYGLADFLNLRARERDLAKRKAQVTLQIEQTESQFDLLQERRDNLLRQYDATLPESPARILVGISRVSARVEYELALTRTDNLRQRLKRIDEQSQLLSEQETYARTHLVSSDLTLTGVQNEVKDARAKVTAMSEKVAAMQPLLLEVLSAEPVNPSLEMLRKQQMTRAVAEAELSQLQQALAQAKSNWYQFKASGAEFNFNLHATVLASRQLTAEALRQADLWSSICQTTLIASPPASNRNAIANFELAQSAARETLALIDQIRNTSDDLLLVEDILSQEVIDAQSGLKNAWVRVVLVTGNAWDRVVELADFNLFEIGDTPVTPAGILKMLLILAFAFGISWLIRYLLNRGVSADKVSQRAAAYTLGRLLHYIVILVGIFAALSSIGIDFTSFALIAGALSVGIGFGLQAIVNNFVSGLILLFEGTLRVGDYIELDSGLAGIVKEINTRATVVNTNDSVDVVVPNSELVTTKLTNWTLREPVARIHIPFGVAYGSDKELVKKVALEAAAETEFALLHQPGREPQLRLVKFGENAMEFEMRVWVSRQGVRRPYRVRSSFLWALESGFQANHIHIPLPQRDIHVRSDFRVQQPEPAVTAVSEQPEPQAQ
jgi:potassium efflux system protein